MCRRTWDGIELKLRDDLAQLFDRAKKLHDEQAGMDEIMQLIFERKSPIWFDLGGVRMTGARVRELPLYQAIKSMARARGVAMGLLSETTPPTHPSLDDFIAKN